MAKFAIPDLRDAAAPRAFTKKLVNDARNGGVDLLVGDDAIGGIAASVVREEEGLPADKNAAEELMCKWRQPGHWLVDNEVRIRENSFLEHGPSARRSGDSPLGKPAAAAAEATSSIPVLAARRLLERLHVRRRRQRRTSGPRF